MRAIPDIGVGTGGAEYLSGDQCVDIVSSALEMGYRHVDTAQAYGNEAEVGEGIARADVAREDVTVATKVERSKLAYDDVLRSARASAERLGLETIDLLYAHFPTHTYDPAETIPALGTLVDDEAVRHIGVSNFSTEDVEEAIAVADRRIVAHQVEMHPLYQRDELLEQAKELDMVLVAYSPLAQGAVFDVPELTQVADKYGTDEAAVTLAWLAEKDNVAAIPKTTSKRHLRANLEAATIELDPGDVELIESISRQEPVYGH